MLKTQLKQLEPWQRVKQASLSRRRHRMRCGLVECGFDESSQTGTVPAASPFMRTAPAEAANALSIVRSLSREVRSSEPNEEQTPVSAL
jgi:hypothetical protein